MVSPPWPGVVRHQAGGDGDRGVCRLPHRFPGAAQRGPLGYCGGRLRGNIRAPRAFPTSCWQPGVIGYLGGRVAPDRFKTGGGHGAFDKSFGPALIDDHTPAPSWARFTWRSAIGHVTVGLVIWALLEGFLYLGYGWHGPLTQMGWFFTKAALVTFGGAYAVLPYVYQGGVDQYGWLTGTQMIDGLALGETTPGPLIMVVAFRRLRRWLDQGDLRAGRPRAGRHCRRDRGDDLHLPAVVPVHSGRRAGSGGHASRSEVHGAAYRHHRRRRGRHYQPGRVLRLARAVARAAEADPFTGRFEWFSLLITIGAFVALWRVQVGVIPVIAASAVAGLVYSLAF